MLVVKNGLPLYNESITGVSDRRIFNAYSDCVFHNPMHM